MAEKRIVKPLVLASLGMATVLITAPCRADPAGGDICEALSRVAGQARQTGAPQRITVFVDTPMDSSCGLSDDVVRDGYCRVALDAIGLEFRHRYPWILANCLRAQGAKPLIETSHAYTGLKRPRIDHLAAGLPDGVRLDLRYTPDSESGDDRFLRGYYGRYDLVAWRP